jgi:hypothetical protein
MGLGSATQLVIDQSGYNKPFTVNSEASNQFFTLRQGNPLQLLQAIRLVNITIVQYGGLL